MGIVGVWLDDPSKWALLADRLRAAGELGIDCETYNQPERASPQHRALVHCWSVGILTNDRSPRGYRRAVGRVLPRAALDDLAIRAVLADPTIKKWAHNAPHDHHSILNAGVEVKNLEDSLQWLRVACPGMRDYGLKAAEQWALGYEPRPGFLEIVTHDVQVTSQRTRKETRCDCGKVPCRARQTADFLADDGVWRPHLRSEVEVVTEVTRTVPTRWAVTDFVPGHERWAEWVAYSLLDATRGIELVSWLRNRRPVEVRYPWK